MCQWTWWWGPALAGANRGRDGGRGGRGSASKSPSNRSDS